MLLMWNKEGMAIIRIKIIILRAKAWRDLVYTYKIYSLLIEGILYKTSLILLSTTFIHFHIGAS